jgi:NADP-dependent 3-hydroxy acid dehydrogenase YdfG
MAERKTAVFTGAASGFGRDISIHEVIEMLQGDDFLNKLK